MHIQTGVIIIDSGIGLMIVAIFDAKAAAEQQLEAEFGGHEELASEVLISELGIASHEASAYPGK